MEMRVIKVDGEFVVVELLNGERKVCPIAIFPKELKIDDVIFTAVKVTD